VRRSGESGFGRPESGFGRSDAGFALASALFAVFLLAVAAALLSAALELRVRVARDEARGVVRTALTDAALAEALAHLAADPAFPGAPEHPFGGGTIASRVERQAADRYQVLARADYRGRARTAAADVERVDGDLQVTAWRRLPQPGAERAEGFSPQ